MKTQTSFSEWLANLLRALASKADPAATIKPPTVAEIAESKLYEARLALLDAESERERGDHTCNMLRERIGRLSGLAGESATLGDLSENRHALNHPVASFSARPHR